MDIRRALEAYRPFNEQEERDQAAMLRAMDAHADIFLRNCECMHMTASAWIVNARHDRVLMAWHNIYRSWSWLGGHADGERDLLAVAVREAREESGLTHVRPVSEDIFSLEILTVNGHEKRGKYVSSHLHLNVTYLLEGDESDDLHAKPDENSGVRWFDLDGAADASSEAWMRARVYQKLNEKLRACFL
ncbi:MAG TPA: NUDIX hydrolase [Candidatus Pullichristensenella avicola]|nr:NUDIX hydrolase [Candidatus Pullichristensenella avicola]